MLTCSPDEIENKLVQYLTNINIMAGLLLSSCISLGINPIEVSNVPEENLQLFGIEIQNYKQLLAQVYNFLGGVSVAIQFGTCMFSTFMLGFVHSLPSKKCLSYFVVLRSGPLLSLFSLLVFLSGFFCIIAVVIAQHIYSTPLGAWLSTGFIGSGFGLLYVFAMYSYARIFPAHAWGWTSVATFGVTYFWRTLRNEAVTVGAFMAGETKEVTIDSFYDVLMPSLLTQNCRIRYKSSQC